MNHLKAAFSEGKPYSVVLLPYATPEGMSLREAIRGDAKFQRDQADCRDGDRHGCRRPGPDPEEKVSRQKLYPAAHPAIPSDGRDRHRDPTVKRPAPAAPVRAAAAGPTQPLAGLHLLVAEDNEMNQFVAQETLRRVGCTCDLAGDGQLAVDAVKNIRYDAVLMDCQMADDGRPGGGRGPIRKWEAATPGRRARMPIIALTAEAIEGDREKCLAAGMDDYVTKPIKPEDLYKAIGALVKKDEPAVATAAGSNAGGRRALPPKRNLRLILPL